jgi:tetratricopeptide (TPR) repeat protein
MHDSALNNPGNLHRRIRRGAACASVILTLGTAAPGARAQLADTAARTAATARELFAQAEQAYAAEEYAIAVNLLRRAYALSPRPAFLFNIAQAQRKLGRCDAARASYQDYLLRETNPAHRERVERILREMPECDAETTPTREPEPDRRLAESIRETAKPAPTPAAASAPATPAQPPPADRSSDTGAQIAKWSLFGAGTVSAGLALYFALDARAASRDLEDATAWSSASSEREARGERSTTLAWVCAGASATLVGAGLTLHFLSKPARARSTAGLSLAPLPGGARASWTSTF